MLQTYKGRTIQHGQKVKVYFNLHKKVFSVMDAKTRKVLGHGKDIALRDPRFEVNENGRQRVLQEGKKNVHAFVTGEYVGTTELDRPVRAQYDAVTYDPYKQGAFTVGDSLVDANRRSYEFAVMEGKKALCR